MSLSLFITEVLSTWLLSLDSNLQKEFSLSKLDHLSVSIVENIRVKPQKARKRKKINKITRIPEIYRKPFWLYKERLLALYLQTFQRPYIKKRFVRQRTDIFPIIWGFSVTLRGAKLWDFLNNFALLQAPIAWNYQNLKTIPSTSQNISLSFKQLNLVQYPQEFPLSFRRVFDIRTTLQFTRPACTNAALTTGLQFPSINFKEDASEEFEI